MKIGHLTLTGAKHLTEKIVNSKGSQNYQMYESNLGRQTLNLMKNLFKRGGQKFNLFKKKLRGGQNLDLL